MFIRSMDQYYEEQGQNTKKLNTAKIDIPELGLSGKFVNGVFENSTSSNNVFRVTYYKHSPNDPGIDFRSPGSILEISKNDFPTTTYLVLFDNGLTSVRASKKITDAWKITGYAYIEASQLLDKKNLPEGRFDIFYNEPPSEGLLTVMLVVVTSKNTRLSEINLLSTGTKDDSHQG